MSLLGRIRVWIADIILDFELRKYIRDMHKRISRDAIRFYRWPMGKDIYGESPAKRYILERMKRQASVSGGDSGDIGSSGVS